MPHFAKISDSNVVEKVEVLPGTTESVVPVAGPAVPPAPTVIGKAVAVTVILFPGVP